MDNINDNIVWEVELDGKFVEIKLEELKQLISVGKVLPQSKVRRGSLRWVEVRDIPILMNGQRFRDQHLRYENKPQAAAHPKYTPVYTERQRNEISFKALKRKQRDESERRASERSGNDSKTFSLVTQISVVLIVSALAAFGWLKYSEHRKWNPTKEDTFDLQAGNRRETAVDRYLSFTAARSGKSLPPFANSQNYTDSKTLNSRDASELDKLHEDILWESIAEFFRNLLVIFLPLGALIGLPHLFKKR